MKSNLLLLIFIVTMSCNDNKNKEVKNSISISNVNPAKILFNNKKLNINKNLLLGKFDYTTDSSFTIVSANLSSRKIYINKTVNDSFMKMAQTAKKEGVNLIVISGTRNFYEQKSIWERKWNNSNSTNNLDKAYKILEYSSMPTTSRHHWGTDIDLINLNNSYFENGKGLKEYNWLINNANRFGFYQVYTDKSSGRTGYNMEKWHWSFKPLSEKYLNKYNKVIKYSDINGFKGFEIASKIDVILKYVNGVD